MPRRYLIHCVTRSDRLNHDRRIRAIGGVNPDGAHWHLGEAEAIAGVEAGMWTFATLTAASGEQPIIVAVSKYGSKYLKGASDDLQPETLLALPECARG